MSRCGARLASDLQPGGPGGVESESEQASAPRLLAILAAGRARAYRPFDQTHADVAELHVLELELGPLQLQRSEGFNFYVPTRIVNVGCFPLGGGRRRARKRAGGQPRAAGSTGQLAVGLAVKGVVRRGSLQGGEGPSVAIEPELLFPSTAGPSEFGLAAGVIVSQRWPALAVHLNLVPAWSRSHQAAGLAGVIIEGPFDWAVRPVAETYVEGEHGAPVPTVSGLVGLIWRAGAALALDAAFRVAMVTLRVQSSSAWARPGTFRSERGGVPRIRMPRTVARFSTR